MSKPADTRINSGPQEEPEKNPATPGECTSLIEHAVTGENRLCISWVQLREGRQKKAALAIRQILMIRDSAERLQALIKLDGDIQRKAFVELCKRVNNLVDLAQTSFSRAVVLRFYAEDALSVLSLCTGSERFRTAEMWLYDFRRMAVGIDPPESIIPQLRKATRADNPIPDEVFRLFIERSRRSPVT